MPQAHEGSNGAGKEPAQLTSVMPRELAQGWLYVRTGLQLLGLLFVNDESLHLAVQALVVMVELAVNLATKHDHR